MNVEPVRLAFKYLCLWLVLAGVVLLLTLLFNLFGTLTCAALAGMMLGAIKHRRWLTLPISAVFPAVLFALMHFSKVELAGSKRVVVPVLCFGLFWVTYFVTGLMMGSEAKIASARVETPEGTKIASAKTIERLCLEQLLGRWRFETTGRDGEIGKVIEIREGKITLSVFDANGRIRSRTDGNFRLETSEPAISSLQPPTHGSSSSPPSSFS